MQTQVKQKRTSPLARIRTTSTVVLPKWIGEITPQPKRAMVRLLKTVTFLKLKEYGRQISVFQERYRVTFDKFEKK